MDLVLTLPRFIGAYKLVQHTWLGLASAWKGKHVSICQAVEGNSIFIVAVLFPREFL